MSNFDTSKPLSGGGKQRRKTRKTRSHPAAGKAGVAGGGRLGMRRIQKIERRLAPAPPQSDRKGCRPLLLVVLHLRSCAPESPELELLKPRHSRPSRTTAAKANRNQRDQRRTRSVHDCNRRRNASSAASMQSPCRSRPGREAERPTLDVNPRRCESLLTTRRHGLVASLAAAPA